MYIKHAGTVDFNLLFWSAGTFYIQALAVSPSERSGNELSGLAKNLTCDLKN